MNQLLPHEVDDVRARTIMHTLDIAIVEASGDRVELTMPVGPKVHQPWGIMHGGASVVLAETAASIGAWLRAGEGFRAVGTDINASHLRAVTSGTVRAVGEPVRQGRTMAVWDVQITDDEQRLICVSRCTLAIRPAADAPRDRAQHPDG